MSDITAPHAFRFKSFDVCNPIDDAPTDLQEFRADAEPAPTL